jgi:lipid II:glycine glycyltransferase (peptidoglycan interpeptide bridge formation enzyme)
MDVSFSYSLTREQQQQWFGFWKNAHHSHPQQHFAMGQIEAARGRKPIFVMGSVANTPVIVAIFSIRPLWFRRRYSLNAVCFSGPIFDDPVYLAPFLKEVVAYFKELRIGQTMISPYWFYPETEAIKTELNKLNFGFVKDTKYTGVIDLCRTEEEIYESISRKTRQQIGYAEKLPVEIRSAETLEEARPLFDCLSKMHLERGVQPMSWAEFKSTYLCLRENPELGTCAVVYYNKIFLAGMFVLCGPESANPMGYAINYVAAKAFPNITFGCGLWWWCFLWARKQGCKFFDVEGYNETAKQEVIVYQVYQFKSRFSPRQVYREHFTCCCNTVTYFILNGSILLGKVGRRITSLPYRIKKRIKLRKQHCCITATLF